LCLVVEEQPAVGMLFPPPKQTTKKKKKERKTSACDVRTIAVSVVALSVAFSAKSFGTEDSAAPGSRTVLFKVVMAAVTTLTVRHAAACQHTTVSQTLQDVRQSDQTLPCGTDCGTSLEVKVIWRFREKPIREFIFKFALYIYI
jgi:hypothetical protein